MKSSHWIVSATALLIVLAACQSGSESSASRAPAPNRFGYQGTQSTQTQFADAPPTPTPTPAPEAPPPQDTAPISHAGDDGGHDSSDARHSLWNAGPRKGRIRDQPARALRRLR